MIKVNLRSPLRKSALSPLVAAMFGSTTAAPAFTVQFSPLTNSTGTVTTSAYINAGVGGGAITPSVTESRLTGVAPLLVHFDASATTAASLTSYPFHEIQYDWDFGDTGAGSWSYGARAQFSAATLKNTDSGPIAAHVFETPGTYTVTMNCRYDGTTGTAVTKTITVDDPDVVFSGTNTICIANGTLPVAGVNGVPTGAACYNESSIATINGYIAKGKRVLLKRGDTWTTATGLVVSDFASGAGHLGAYGTGARPIITASADIFGVNISTANAAGITDFRVTDIEFNGGDIAGNSTCVYYANYVKDLLIHNVKVSLAKYGIQGVEVTSGLQPDTVGIVGCEVADGAAGTSSGGNGIYCGARRLVLMGTLVRPNYLGEHGCRTYWSNRAVYSHNSIRDVVATKTHLSVRAPLSFGSPLGGYTGYDDGGYIYTEKIVIRDNYGVQTDDSELSMGTGPVNQAAIGRVRNVIFENNYVLRGSWGILGRQITIRNNITQKLPTNGILFAVEALDNQPHPTDIWAYNNSYYSEAAAEATFSTLLSFMPGSTMTATNNLLYAPSDTGDTTDLWRNFDPTTVTNMAVVTSNNTTDSLTNPNFATSPPTTPTQFRPTSGYAVAGGTTVPVWTDFAGSTVTGATRTIGAVKN